MYVTEVNIVDTSVKEWINEAEDNLVTAKLLYQGERFKDVEYYCHQIIEKALKAVQIWKLRRFDMTHDLTTLAKSVDAARSVILKCERLTERYIPSKYPVAKRGTFTEKDAEKSLADAEEVLEWARSTLK